MIEYKGYVGVFEYDPEGEEFHGRIVNLKRDGATFVGRSVDDLKREMAASVDELIAFCEEQGIEPEKPSPFLELDRLRYLLESAQARFAEHPDVILNGYARTVAAPRRLHVTHDATAFRAALSQSIEKAAQSMQAASSLLSHLSPLTPQPLGASSFDYLHNHRVSFPAYQSSYLPTVFRPPNITPQASED